MTFTFNIGDEMDDHQMYRLLNAIRDTAISGGHTRTFDRKRVPDICRNVLDQLGYDCSDVWSEQHSDTVLRVAWDRPYPSNPEMTLLYPTYTAQDALFITIDSHERPDDPCDAF